MEKRILCFGDSNTWGYNAADLTRYNENTRYPRVLEKLLNEKGSGEYRVIEEGLSGRTFVFDDPFTEGLSGLSYIRPCLATHTPVDLIIIALGTNDTKERFSANASNIALGANRLIKKIKMEKELLANAKILILAPARIGKEYTNNVEISANMGAGCHEKSVALIEELRKVAELNNCAFLNTDEFLTMNKIDYMHLEPSEHKKLAIKLSDLIPSLI